MTLLLAKSRVKPSKMGYTVPKLKLLGPELMVAFAQDVREAIITAMKLNNLHPNFKTYHFSDSEIVLAWLQTPEIIRTTFVQNRLNKIRQRITTSDSFHHVRGEENIADIASRGCGAHELSDEWWNSPNFLLNPNALEMLPTQEFKTKEERRSVQEEELEIMMRKVTTIERDDTIIEEHLEKLSTWKATLRRMQTILQAVQAFTKRQQTPDATEKCFNTIIKIYQRKAYPEEVHRLLNRMKAAPKYANLNLFLEPQEQCTLRY